LGVERSADRAELEAAYLNAARLLHPDSSHAPELSDLRRELEAVFARVVEAHRVLSSPRARAEYEAGLILAGFVPPHEAEGEPPAPPAPVDLAAEAARAESLFAEAEAAVARGHSWEALLTLDSALQLARGRIRRRARMLRASIYLKNARWQREAAAELETAVREDPGNLEALLLLARVYQGAGCSARAAGLLRRVLEQRPGHPDAQAALAALPKAAARGGLRGLPSR
jgi:curved DNA-binding protein CbpA